MRYCQHSSRKEPVNSHISSRVLFVSLSSSFASPFSSLCPTKVRVLPDLVESNHIKTQPVEIVLVILFFGSFRSRCLGRSNLLVEGLGVGGGDHDVGVAHRLVGASGELVLVDDLQIVVVGGSVGGDIVLQEEFAEREKPQEGDEIIGFDTSTVYLSESLPRGQREGRTWWMCFLHPNPINL